MWGFKSAQLLLGVLNMKTAGIVVSYVFSAVSYIEQQQMNRNIHFCTSQRGIKKKGADGSISYKLDDPWVVFENISNSPK